MVSVGLALAGQNAIFEVALQVGAQVLHGLLDGAVIEGRRVHRCLGRPVCQAHGLLHGHPSRLAEGGDAGVAALQGVAGITGFLGDGRQRFGCGGAQVAKHLLKLGVHGTQLCTGVDGLLAELDYLVHGEADAHRSSHSAQGVGQTGQVGTDVANTTVESVIIDLCIDANLAVVCGHVYPSSIWF